MFRYSSSCGSLSLFCHSWLAVSWCLLPSGVEKTMTNIGVNSMTSSGRQQRRPASRRRRIPQRMPVRLSGLWKAGVAMQAIARSARTEHARPDQTTTPSAAAAAAALDVGEGCAVERRLCSMHMSVAETSTEEERGSTTVTVVGGVDSDTTARTTDDGGVSSSLDDVTSSSDDVTSSLDDVTSSSDDVTSSLDDVTSSSDDVTSSMDDVTSSSDDVTSSSDDVTSAGDAPRDGVERRVLDGEQGAELLSEDRPGRSVDSSYDFGKSTAENYRVEHEEFSDRFRDARSLLDYSYHDNYCLERQKVQDEIILKALGSTTPSLLERPWAVFTAGAMGAGKSHVMELLGERGIFPLDSFVRVDPDRLRRELPEMQGYVQRDPVTAGLLTHKEAGLMAEILEETSLLEGRNILVDGSMRDGEWYAQHVADLRRRFPMLRVAIIHVWAPREQVLARAARRGIQTGRVIPPAVLEETLQAVPRSVEKLAPFVDYCVRIDNIGDTASPSSKLCPNGSSARSPCGELRSGSGESVCNGLGEPECNGLGESACNGWGESACNGLDEPECNGSEGSLVGLPILATPGETWETFRRTFQGPFVGMVPEKVPKATEELLNLPVEVE